VNAYKGWVRLQSMDSHSLFDRIKEIVKGNAVEGSLNEGDWLFVVLPFTSPYRTFLNAHFFAFRGAYKKVFDQQGNTTDFEACIVLKNINRQNVIVEKFYKYPELFEGDVRLLFRMQQQTQADEKLHRVIGVLQQLIDTVK
jgi:hypothetical protein